MTIHTEKIKCPRCRKECNAKVWHTLPWNSYVHHCEHCNYIIMESEWEQIENQNSQITSHKS